MSHRSPKPLVLFLGLVLLVLSASVAFVPIRSDNDCWWHVKTGKYISENGIPRSDVFAFTAEDHSWDNHEWLMQVIYWQAWRWGDATGLGGWRAVIGLTALLSVLSWAAVAWLVQRRIRHWPLALLIAIWVVAIGRRTLYPRPPVMTYFLFAIALWILYEVRLGRWSPRRLWLLVPLVAVWSNLHGGWMAALAAVGMFSADAFLSATRRWWHSIRLLNERGAEPPGIREREERARRVAFALGLALLGVIAASCANPFGWRLYLLPGRVMSDTFLVRSIGELQSPDFYYTVAFEMALILPLAGLCVIRRRPLVASDVFLFLFWAHQGIQHVRHLPMFAIAAAPLLGVVARELLRDIHATDWSRALGLSRRSSWALGGIALILALYVARNPREGQSYWARNRELLLGREYVAENYPREACDFVLLNDIKGNLYNRNYYAGYLIWRLAPEQTRVFTDSRFDIFGGKFLEDENLIANGVETPRPGLHWRERLDHYKIDWILIADTEPLAARLRADNAWERVYVDGPWSRARTRWSIWIRKTETTEAIRERCRMSFTALAGAPAHTLP